MSNRIRRAMVSGAAGAVTATLGTLTATASLAEVPQVATDIAPVHGLASRVMEGLGTPKLVVRQGASPHGYSMRPSEAGALAEADLVFWVGPELEPWLGESISSLAEGAEVIELLEAPGTRTLTFREGATFEPHEHGDEGHDHGADGEEHDHEADHAEHEHAAEDDHAEHEHAEGHHHDHHGTDPHAWLDPENGKAWLDAIAAELAEADPEHAEAYEANAKDGKAEIDAATQDIRALLEPAEGMRFVVFHDAYQYFETRFGLPAAGAISVGDATDPSAGRVQEVRDTVKDLGVTCVFSEPQFNQAIVQTVLEGTGGHSGTIDPLGTDLELGSDFYTDLLHEVAEEMAQCNAAD